MNGYVYAISSTRTPLAVKLGKSSTPEQRLRNLQTGNHVALVLRWSCPVPNMKVAENLIHSHFRNYRVSGEWFDLTHVGSLDNLGILLTKVVNDRFGFTAVTREQVTEAERKFHEITDATKSTMVARSANRKLFSYQEKGGGP